MLSDSIHIIMYNHEKPKKQSYCSQSVCTPPMHFMSLIIPSNLYYIIWFTHSHKHTWYGMKCTYVKCTFMHFVPRSIFVRVVMYNVSYMKCTWHVHAITIFLRVFHNSIQPRENFYFVSLKPCVIESSSTCLYSYDVQGNQSTCIVEYIKSSGVQSPCEHAVNIAHDFSIECVPRTTLYVIFLHTVSMCHKMMSLVFIFICLTW